MRLRHVEGLLSHVKQIQNMPESRRKGLRPETEALVGRWSQHSYFEQDVQKASQKHGFPTASSPQLNFLRERLSSDLADIIHGYNREHQSPAPVYLNGRLQYWIKKRLREAQKIKPLQDVSLKPLASKVRTKSKTPFKSRALAFLARGWSIDKVVQALQNRYHPNLSVEQVRKRYFPARGPYAISRLEGASRKAILEKMGQIREQLDKLRRLNEDPEFAAARVNRSSELMRRLHEDPKFAAARDKRSSELIRRLNKDPKFAAAGKERLRRLNKDPKFAAARNERLRQLNEDPKFRRRQREGVRRFWVAYRAAKSGGRRGAWEGKDEARRPVPVEDETPESIVLEGIELKNIRDAVLRLPADQRSVVAEEFGLDLPGGMTSSQAHLTANQRNKMLNKALASLRENERLKRLNE